MPAPAKVEEHVRQADPGSDVGIGMNDGSLMEFNTWRVMNSELLQAGLVASWNNHETKTCGVLWWGPSTAGLDQVREEAARRGIKFVVRSAKYSPADLDGVVQVLLGASKDLLALGFDLSSLSGRGGEHQGVRLTGRAVGEPGEVNACYLPEDLARRVQHHVIKLPGVAGVIEPEDVLVEYGHYSY